MGGIKYRNTKKRFAMKKRNTGGVGSVVVAVTTKKSKRLCLMCTMIRRLLFSPPPKNFREIQYHRLGPLDSVMSQCCEVCSQIFCPDIGSVRIQAPNDDVRLYKGDGASYISISIGRGPIRKHLGLLLDGKPTQSYGYAYKVDTKWVDVEGIRERLSNCLKFHGTVCPVSKSSNPSLQTRPAWLIDIKRMCIIQSTTSMRYIALSYVWGRTTTLQLLKCNLGDLQKKDILRNPLYSSRLPKTIADAIQLTRLLREQYLWVDRFCIVQDDEAALYSQINYMASIYANAYVTIVAAQGANANCGLRGVHGGSRSRLFKQRIHSIAQRYQLVELLDTWPLYENSIWATRAWTFQEHIFSNRRIVFYKDTVRWECSEIWLEDRKVPENGTEPPGLFPKKPREGPYFIDLPWPNLDLYRDLVEHYNSRDLTYPEDNLRAFAGVTTALSYSFEFGFVCGLPELFIDTAMLWHPENLIQRRVSSQTSAKNALPSWTWAGWCGDISSWCWLIDYVKSWSSTSLLSEYCHTTCRVFPRVQWYCAQTVTGTRRRLDGPHILRQYRRNARNPQIPLPTGWSRHTTHVRPRHELDMNNKMDLQTFYENLHAFDKDKSVYYTHESDPGTHFWYPIPIRDKALPVTIRNLEPYLFCHTERAVLYATREAYKSYPSATLQTQDREWAGILLLNGDDRIIENHIASNDTIGTRIICEVIAISAGHAANSFSEKFLLPEWEHPDRPKDTPLYEYINVLWIQWELGIAYRKAVGRVLKTVWKGLELEWIDVVLG